MPERPKIFLSYASEDRAKVESLYTELSKRGFDPWYDKERLISGDNWRMKILKAVSESDFFAVCFSEQAITKKGVNHEELRLGIEVYKKRPIGSAFFISLKLEPCTLPEIKIDANYSLKDFQWFNHFINSKENFDSISAHLEQQYKDMTKNSKGQQPGNYSIDENLTWCYFDTSKLQRKLKKYKSDCQENFRVLLFERNEDNLYQKLHLMTHQWHCDDVEKPFKKPAHFVRFKLIDEYDEIEDIWQGMFEHHFKLTGDRKEIIDKFLQGEYAKQHITVYQYIDDCSDPVKLNDYLDLFRAIEFPNPFHLIIYLSKEDFQSSNVLRNNCFYCTNNYFEEIEKDYFDEFYEDKGCGHYDPKKNIPEGKKITLKEAIEHLEFIG